MSQHDPDTPAIDVRGISKRFGSVDALLDVTLAVMPREVVGLLGPNGAGKSTLTRILATTVLPDAGVATVCGIDVVAEPARARHVLGVSLSDERSWYWRLSGRQNLRFFAALYGYGRKQSAERVSELLHRFDLDAAADRRFDGYSAGMKSKLSLARALLPDPPVLLLDEPTRSLDPIAAAEFRKIIVQLVEEHDKAVLLATHNLEEAALLSNRVAVLAGGRVVESTSARSSAETLALLLRAATRPEHVKS